MKNRKLTAFALALLLCASCALTSCFGGNGGEEQQGSGSDTETEQAGQGLPVGDDTPEMTDTAPLPQVTPPETEPPETEPPETELPETEPPANELDDVPTEPGGDDAEDVTDIPTYEELATEESDYDGAPIIITDLAGLAGQRDSGRFVSEQSPNLVLCIDWESVIGTDGIADVTVTVGISHYRLFSREKFEMGAIQVDGNAVKFSTPKIEYDENTKTYTEFYSATYETNRSEMEIEASWQVLGKYGDIEIDTLTCGGTVVLGGDS